MTHDPFTWKRKSRPLFLLIHITTSLRLQPLPAHPRLPHVIYTTFFFQLLNVYPWTTLTIFWGTDFTFKYTFYRKILRCSAACYIHASTAWKICISDFIKYDILFPNLMLTKVLDIYSTSLSICLRLVQFISVIFLIISVARSRGLANSNDVCIVSLESKMYIWNS